ncbi:MAG: HEAT repeat domain-containing protein [bacterium]
MCLSVMGQSFDPRTATMDELLARVARNGNTEERRAAKEQARQEIYARKTDAFRFLMERVHLDNVSIQVLAQEMIDKLAADEAVPVLLAFAKSEDPDTQKLAVFFLGFYPAAATNAAAVAPLLKVDKALNAAIRTLGKWRYTNATPEIAALLKNPKERTRVAAANALRDIGDPRGIQSLVDALNDQIFTVRNTAERALQSFGAQAEGQLIHALEHPRNTAMRPVIHLLGQMKSQKAYKLLKALAENPDAYVREDANQALLGIHPTLIDRLF